MNTQMIENKTPKAISAISDKSNINTVYDYIFIPISKKIVDTLKLPRQKSLRIHCVLFQEVTLTELQLYFKQKHMKGIWEYFDEYLSHTIYNKPIQGTNKNPFHNYAAKVLNHKNHITTMQNSYKKAYPNIVISYTILPYYKGYRKGKLEEFFTYEISNTQETIE